MITSDRFSVLAAWTEYRFKKYIFSLLKFGKTTGLRSETWHKHLENTYKNWKIFFLRFTIFEIVLIFSFRNKNFKRIGCAKASLL